MAARRSGPPVPAGLRGSGAALTALRTSGLTKLYRDVAAVDGLDLTVERGELYGFLGPNGAGKTTTIRMALGLIFPTTGEVSLLGEPVFGPGDDRRLAPGARERRVLRRVGALIEEPGFWRFLSGRRNLEAFARAAGPRADRDARLARVDEVLRLVDLDGAAGKKVNAYSQGMRQRLGIALALLGAPDVLILDEPTNGLDPQGMRDIRLLLRRLADGGTTVFVSSHLLWEVEAMCDRVGVLARGRLVAEGAPGTLRAVTNRVHLEVDDEPRARRILEEVFGIILSTDGDGRLSVRLSGQAEAADLNEALVSGGVRVNALVPERATLEDVFLDLVESRTPPPDQAVTEGADVSR